MSQTRVVVTGLGATTPVGGDVAGFWTGLTEGRSGAVTLDDPAFADLPARVAAPVAVDPSEVLDRVRARRLDRSAQLAIIAAEQAWADSGLADAGTDPTRIGVAVASGIGGVTTLLANFEAMQEKGPRRVSPLAIPMLMPNAPAAQISLALGAAAGVHSPVSACASGNESIALGLDQIRLGRADVVIVGGTEAAIHPLPMAAFAQMRALSKRNDDPTRASRPWDSGRDGFVLGEGAGILVIESEEHARARGAHIYAELAGAGITADNHDIAQPHPDGVGASRAMRMALEAAGVEPGDIRHVNAHATSTPQGDVAEAGAIRGVLGAAADRAVVTGTKSMTGHLLGGAGAIESVATVLALHHRTVPPTINLDDLDPAVDIDIATKVRELPVGDVAALNNSFGFGGHNVALVFTSA